MELMATLDKSIADYVVKIRRVIHQNPEISNGEEATCRLICTELELMGIEYEIVKPYSVVGTISKGTGKRIAVRADIDALPMDEKTDLPFKSQNAGLAHLCGHDGHTAILLGLAKHLSETGIAFNGTIHLCFQGAEEIGEGAKEIIHYLDKKEGVDAAIGLHVVPELVTGQISIEAGPRMSGASGFGVKVIGRGGHGSRPDRCNDPIRPACEMILKLSSIPANRMNPLEPTVVNIGMMSSGSARNVIPDEALFEGTFRYFAYGADKRIMEKMKGMIEGTATCYDVLAENVFSGAVPPVVNDKDASAIAHKAIAEIIGLSAQEVEPNCASDNFGCFLEKYSGMYAFLGAVKNVAEAYPHHHAKFDIDEDALQYGVLFFANYLQVFFT